MSWFLLFKHHSGLDGGGLYWDVDRLFQEVLTGMKKCAKAGKIPESVGIDTWGVDYVLVDKGGKEAGTAHCIQRFQDRTDG